MVSGRDWGLYEGRAVSFAAAVSVTWYLNRRLTFGDRRSRRRGAEYGRYLGTQIVGAAINLAIYAGVIAAVPPLASYPVVPLAAGSGLAMVFNFLAARHFAFAGSPSRNDPC